MKRTSSARHILIAFLFAAVQSIYAQTTPTVQFQTVPLAIPAGTLGFADFNGDGYLDSVGLNTANQNIVVYAGNGYGSFSSTATLTPVSADPAYTFSDHLIVANAHNKNNPHPGIAFFASQFNSSGTLMDYGVILGDGVGNGTFGLCTNDIICLPNSPNYTAAPTVLLLAAGDFTHDGNTDIAFATQFPDQATSGLFDDSFMVYTGDGYGDLYEVTLPQSLLPVQVGTQTPNPSAVPADVLGNGYPWLLVNPGSVTSQGTVTPSGLELGVNNQNGTFSAGTTVLAGSQIAQYVPVDINGDGKLDIVYTAVGTQAVMAIEGDGVGNFGSPITLVTAPSSVNGVIGFSLVDLNGDGKLDIVFSGTSNGLFWASGNGDGSFNTPALIAANDTLSPYAAYPLQPLLGATNGMTNPFAWGAKNAYVLMAGPQLTINASTLSFSGQFVNSTSAAQTVMLTNTGGQALNISSIVASSGFTETNTCGATLAPAASCNVLVSFAPTATGSLAGSLTITDNAPNSPQTVALNGTGTSISIAAASGSSTSSTINSGGTATYQLAVSPVSGFTGAITASCTGAPSGYQCSASPASFSLSGSPVNVTFTVSPSNAAKAEGKNVRELLGRTSGGLLFACLLIGFIPRRYRNRFAALSFVCAGLISFAGCGGSSNGNHSIPAPQSYTLTAQFTNSTGQSLTQSLSLTINGI